MSLYVLDTHVLLWLRGAKKEKFSKRVKKIIEKFESKQAHFYIPATVIWELGSLIKSGKLKLPKTSFRTWIKSILDYPNVIFVDTTLEDTLIAAELGINRDPCDNLIAATAIRLETPLITKDEAIKDSRTCEVIW